MKRVTVLLFLLCSCIAIHAQNSRLYTAENGLSSSQVNCLCQDRDGYIWIGSQDGVFRFDGMASDIFLPGQSVSAIFEDSGGAMWVGSSTGLFRYDRSLHSFTKYNVPDNNGQNSSQYIVSLAESVSYTGRSELLVCSSSSGCYFIDLETLVVDVERSRFTNDKLLSPYISSCLVDHGGSIWFALDDGGLTVFDVSGDVRYYRDYFVSAMAEDNVTGNVALGTYSQGLFIYEKQSHKIVKADHPSLQGADIRALLYYNDTHEPGRILVVGTEDNGYHYLPLLPSGLVDEGGEIPQRGQPWKIHALLADSQGNVWFGAYQKGVIVHPNSLYGFSSRQFPACVTSICVDVEGNTYVGTDGSGLFVTDSRGRTRNYNKENSVLSTNAVLSVDIDGNGNTWVGTYLGGLYLLDRSGRLSAFVAEGLDDRIKTIAYNPADNNIYIGTSGGGLAVISSSTHKLVNIICTNDNQWVSSLLVASDGTVWVGTYDGVLQYLTNSGELARTELWGTGEENRVYCIDEGRNGALWIGTGDGIVQYNRVTGHLGQRITKNQGLGNGSVKGLLCSEDDVWVSTGAGLSRYRISKGRVSTYYAYDGLQGNEFHTGATERTPDGLFYFGGTNGISYFDPAMVNSGGHKMPAIKFTKLTVMNEATDINPDVPIVIPNRSKLFSIGFMVAEYTNPEKVVYSYRMEDFDTGWHRVGSRVRSATYTNLPHGRYVFRVRAFFEGEEDNYTETSIAIRIENPWYLKWWAMLTYLLLFLTLVSFVWLILRRRASEKKEKQLAALKEMRLGMFTNMTHEIRTPLSLVMSPLKRMRESEQDPKQRDAYNLMYRNCLRINRIVNQLMDLRKVDEGQMKLHFVKTDIVKFILDIMHSFDELASSNNISFSLDTVSTPEFIWLDPGNFDKIIFNILSNAFKFTPQNGRITITLKEEEGNLGISIFNSGSHIDDDAVEKVFERFYQADGNFTYNGSGVGLNLTKLLVELHHGTVRARNTEEGVVFEISVPCGSDHLTAEELSTTLHHQGLYPVQNTREEVVPSVSLKPNTDKTIKSKKNLVIVEDDTEALEYLRGELGNRFSVKCYTSGQEAFQEICRTLPDAIVTDLVMPGMSGLELCSKIKHNPSTNHIPVIVLTSESDDETRKACSDAGADRYFAKPASMDVMESEIARAIASYETIRGKFSNTADYGFESVTMPFDKGKLYEKMIGVIKANLDNSEFSVDDLSRELGMSRVHLNRKTKELGCPPPSMLIKSIRLKQAAYLLVGSNVNVSEIAFRVGFASHSYFTKAFREYFGMSPKEFIQKYKNRQDSEEFRKLVE